LRNADCLWNVFWMYHLLTGHCPKNGFCPDRRRSGHSPIPGPCGVMGINPRNAAQLRVIERIGPWLFASFDVVAYE
jgi:hypothetical protein